MRLPDAHWVTIRSRPRLLNQPMLFAPSMVSRMTSACPQCCAVSAMTCRMTRRTDQLAPASNHGASGSGCAASRSGSEATSSSVRAATRS